MTRGESLIAMLSGLEVEAADTNPVALVAAVAAAADAAVATNEGALGHSLLEIG